MATHGCISIHWYVKSHGTYCRFSLTLFLLACLWAGALLPSKTALTSFLPPLFPVPMVFSMSTHTQEERPGCGSFHSFHLLPKLPSYRVWCGPTLDINGIQTATTQGTFNKEENQGSTSLHIYRHFSLWRRNGHVVWCRLQRRQSWELLLSSSSILRHLNNPCPLGYLHVIVHSSTAAYTLPVSDWTRFIHIENWFVWDY